MNPELQSYAALAIVGVTGVWLVWHYVGRKKKTGCGGGCGCPADEFKEKLKR